MAGDVTFLDTGQLRADSPGIIFPQRCHIFLDRARRFAFLAERHPFTDWLSFLGRLTQIQHELLQEYPSFSLSDEGVWSSTRKHHLPPIASSSRSLDPCWRRAAVMLASELSPYAPTPARETLRQLQQLDSVVLDALADRVLQFEMDEQNAPFSPFVAAALQIHFTALAAGHDQTMLGPLDASGFCPCCGFPPVAGIVRVDGEVNRLRYLHCSLCNTQWHLVRITCASCLEGDHIAYFHIEGSDGSVRAETCDDCRSYLKIVYREKSLQADPIADDLATLALDLLVQEAGYNRRSPNLLFEVGGNSGVLGR